MWHHKRIVGILGAFVCALGLGSFFILSGGAADSFADRAYACTSSGGGTRGNDDCYRAVALDALQERDGASLIQELSRADSVRCHAPGHLLGEEVWKKYRSVETALAHCGLQCGAACTHGIVTAALMTSDPSASHEELRHPNDALLRERGVEYCAKRAETCHAVGHVLLLLYQDLDQASARCADLTTTTERWFACLRGVFMESFHTLPVQPMMKVESGEVPNLLFPCDEVEDHYVAPCLSLLGVEQKKTFAALNITDERVQEDMRFDACGRMAKRAHYLACVESAAWAKESLSVCDRFEEGDVKTMCVYGVARGWAASDQYESVVGYCAMQPSHVLKTSCYDAYFAIHDSRKIYPLSEACANSMDSACPQHLGRFIRDSTNDTFFRMIEAQSYAQ